jgi:ribosomal protein S18 acetylase RimI-like enzyme
MTTGEISSLRDRGQAAGAGHVLDRPAWSALVGGPHAHLAERHGRAVRYRPEVSPFAALEDPADEECWADAAALLGAGATLLCLPGTTEAPAGWEPVFAEECVQLTDDAVDARPDPEAVVLGLGDLPEMLDLIERTRPGPFLPGTIAMGTFLGVRREGRLVAMAGQRQRPPGWTEVSAVCTDPAHRGQGLATRLVRAVVAGVRERGEHAYLHALASNTDALGVYESLGFTPRRRAWVTGFRLR